MVFTKKKHPLIPSLLQRFCGYGDVRVMRKEKGCFNMFVDVSSIQSHTGLAAMVT